MAVELPGEAHAAVGLDVLLGRDVERVGRAHARRRRGHREVGRLGGERPRAVVRVGPRELDAHVHVHQLVLDGLERGDRPAEREAAERVLARHVERGLGAAHLLEGEQHGGPVEEPAEQRPALAGRAERLGRRALEGDAGMRARGIHGAHRRPRDTGRREVGEEQGVAPAMTTATSATSPSATGSLTPVRRPAWARVSMAPGAGGRVPSARARQPMISPSASRGRYRFFCSALPASWMASVARYTEDENGVGARLRPSSSAITQSSR